MEIVSSAVSGMMLLADDKTGDKWKDLFFSRIEKDLAKIEKTVKVAKVVKK